MPDNTLRGESQPYEQIEGKTITNVKTTRAVRFESPDGNSQEILMSASNSSPDESGNWIVTELLNVATDRAGNPLPEDPRSVTHSHSGLYINSLEKGALCSSWLHPPSRSRNILIGQDGRKTKNGAICSWCNFWQTTIYISIGILGIGLILGLWKGVGLF